MAAPTNAAFVKKALARHALHLQNKSAVHLKTDVVITLAHPCGAFRDAGSADPSHRGGEQNAVRRLHADPNCRIGLVRNAHETSALADALAEHIVSSLDNLSDAQAAE